MSEKKDDVNNPVDDYLETKKLAAQRRREDDIALIKQWQDQDRTGQVDPTLSEQMFQRFEPVRRSAANRFKAPLTGPGFDTKSRTLMVDAWRSYDPNRGAAPVTHMTNTLRRLYRENLQGQSVQNTEAEAGLFGKIDRARSELSDELGRDPTEEETLGRINEYLPKKKAIDLPRLQQVQQRRGGTVVSSAFESLPEGAPPIQHQQQLEQQRLDLLPYDLDDQELAVYNHLFGRGGQKPTTSTNEIAQRMGVSAPTISRLRRRIAVKANVTEDQLAASRKPRKPRVI